MTRIQRFANGAAAIVSTITLLGSVFTPVTASAISFNNNEGGNHYHNGHDRNVGNHDNNDDDNQGEQDDNEDDGDGGSHTVTGSITVCKVLVDSNGAVVAGTAGSAFSVTLSKGDTSDVAYFTTPITTDSEVISNDVNDGTCQTFENLKLGTWNYGEEAITSSQSFETVLYSDQFSQAVNSVSDLYTYNQAGNAHNADGTITLTKSRKDRTLIVYNKMKQSDVTVVASKVVCDSETDLPNWSGSGMTIGASTAADYVAASEGRCHLQSGWSFEWGNQDAGDAGDAFTGPAGNGYTTFGATNVNGVTSTSIPLAGVSEIHLREVLQPGYIGFTHTAHPDNSDTVSAEFYCANDVLNYDNLDYIRNPQAGSTYNCVAFNALSCDANASQLIVSDATTTDTTDAHAAVPLSFIHSAWKATTNPIAMDPSAVWIWSDNPVMNPLVDTTKVFTRTFTIVGTPTGGSIDIGADNGFILKVNGTTIDNQLAEEHNYEASKHYDISSALVSGTNTLEITVKNFGISDSSAASNPAGLVYQVHLTNNECTVPPPPSCPEGQHYNSDHTCVADAPICNANTEMIQNGSFETPVVADNGATWQLYPNATPNLNWTVAYISGNPSPMLEIQNALLGWAASDGVQLAELDSNEASIVSQDVPTVVGQAYTLKYDFSARPNTTAENNAVDVFVGGVLSSNVPATLPGVSTSWTTHSVTFTATTSTTTIAFRDAGTPNDSYGSLVDNVSMRCVPAVVPPPVDVCPNIQGNQSTAPQGMHVDGETHQCVDDVVPPPVDVCSNIQGNQATPPSGTHLDEGQCVDDESTPNDDSTPNGGGGGGGGGGGQSFGNGPIWGGGGNGQVLGASTSTDGLPNGCVAIIDTYMRWHNKKNDPADVKDLQNFLNEEMHAGIPVTGFFGPLTDKWVRAFQSKYPNETLTPWGLPDTTGFVYKTTQRWINLVHCKSLSIPVPTDLSPYHHEDEN